MAPSQMAQLLPGLDQLRPFAWAHTFPAPGAPASVSILGSRNSRGSNPIAGGGCCSLMAATGHNRAKICHCAQFRACSRTMGPAQLFVVNWIHQGLLAPDASEAKWSLAPRKLLDQKAMCLAGGPSFARLSTDLASPPTTCWRQCQPAHARLWPPCAYLTTPMARLIGQDSQLTCRIRLAFSSNQHLQANDLAGDLRSFSGRPDPFESQQSTRGPRASTPKQPSQNCGIGRSTAEINVGVGVIVTGGKVEHGAFQSVSTTPLRSYWAGLLAAVGRDRLSSPSTGFRG